MSNPTTSTQPYTSASASTARDIQQSMTEASLPQPPAPQHTAPKDSWIEKLVWPIMGMILTAVVAYFSAFVAVKDDISTNRQDVTVLKNDITHINEKISDLKEDISQTKGNNSEIMVLKTKVENLEYNSRVKTNSKSK